VAILFELVVNYGRNEQAAQDAARMATTHPPLRAGRHRIPLAAPVLRTVEAREGEPYLEMAIVPVGVGFRPGWERLRLTAGELSELGHDLYSLLSTFSGYRVAMVGIDPEILVDPVELRMDWADELADGSLTGLVLAEDLHRSLPESRGFVPFSDGFVWIPYRGERNPN
jgi:hypothetical protein